MITNYFNFFKLYEANAEESLKLSKDFVIKIYKSRAISEKKAKTKADILLATPDIELEELKKQVNATALTPGEERKITNNAIRDPFLLRLEDIFKNKQEWLDIFVRLFFTYFKNYKINSDPSSPNSDYEKIVALLGQYTIIDKEDSSTNEEEYIWNDNSEDSYGSIGEAYSQLLDLPGDIQKTILNKNIVNYINKAKQLWTGVTDTDDPRDAMEMMSDDIRDMSNIKNINSLIERLPKGTTVGDKVLYNIYDEYKTTTDTKLKETINSNLGNLVNILKSKKIDVKPVRTVLNGKEIITYPYESIFKIRAGSAQTGQLDKSLEDFSKRLSNTLTSLNDTSMTKLLDLIIDFNKKNSESTGIDVVYNEDGKIVINIKSHKANCYLHNRSNGKMSLTSHCIAYDSSSNWDSRLEGEKAYNKLYYVYNFNLDKLSNLFPFGLIINPDGTVDSSHNKEDDSLLGSVKEIIKKFKIPFSIFAPISKEEKLKLDLKLDGKKLICLPDIDIEQIKALLDQGVNPNERNGTPLQNAMKSENIEVIKYLLEHGADPALGNGIVSCKSLKTLYIILKFGVEKNINLIPTPVRQVLNTILDVKDKDELLRKEVMKLAIRSLNHETITLDILNDKIASWYLEKDYFDVFQTLVDTLAKFKELGLMFSPLLTAIEHDYTGNRRLEYYLYLLEKNLVAIDFENNEYGSPKSAEKKMSDKYDSISQIFDEVKAFIPEKLEQFRNLANTKYWKNPSSQYPEF